MTPNELRIVVVGLGNMGWPMAANLVRAGFPTIGYDRDAERTAAFSAEFGIKDDSLEALGDADVIITMLPTSRIVATALVGHDSVMASRLKAGALVIDMSSSQPLETLRLGELLEQRGVRLIDAPVSGGVQGAINGTLTIMVGADNDADADDAAVVLEALGDRIFRVGGLGAGHALKALNNFVGASGFAAACEALLVAERYGLEPEVFLDVLNASTGRNFSTDFTLPTAVLTGAFNTGFPLALMTKDVEIAATLAHELGQTAVLADTVYGQLKAALDGLGPDVDHSAAIKHWSGSAGYRDTIVEPEDA
jgi:3-hydroxyisobutyrate dehydrogenase